LYLIKSDTCGTKFSLFDFMETVSIIIYSTKSFLERFLGILEGKRRNRREFIDVVFFKDSDKDYTVCIIPERLT
jgi:hypothetical protein